MLRMNNNQSNRNRRKSRTEQSKQKIANYLHMATKAGKTKVGMSAAYSSCVKKKAGLILCAVDMSENSMKKIKDIAEKQNIRFVLYGDKQEYSDIFNRNVTGIVSIEDKNFASGILNELV